MASFDEVLKDCTKLGTKIPTSEYLENGKYPIIDQGQNAIAGYYDSDDGLFKDVPAIVFGDHTRVVKYVDKPCFLGADGVKLLCPVDKDINCKYLFYQLSYADIPNTGYNRHFKWVKALDFKIPLSDEQNHVVEVLDKVTELISLRKQQLARLDELVRARFVEMFGEPVKNTMNWPQKLLRDVTIKIGSGATPKGGKESYPNVGVSLIRSMNVYDGQFLYKDLAHLTDEQATQLNGVTVEEEDVLVNITGASVARSCVVPKNVLPARVNQHVAIVRCNKKLLNPVFTNKMFINNEFKKILLSIGESGGATRQAITKKQLEELSVIAPPLSLQNEFATFVECVDQQKQTVQQSLKKLELMKKALMQEYFG